jgi:superfamily II DNA or RNA helicase
MNETNWPHQDRGKSLIKTARLSGVRSGLAVAPPGAGKSRVMSQMSQEEVANGGRVKIYLHRTMLCEQLARTFREQGIYHGVQASGVEPDFAAPIQICMTDTVYARAVQRSDWELGSPSLVMLDEAHQQTGSKARAVVYGGDTDSAMLRGHHRDGAFVLGFTGTPVNCGSFYESIIPFGTYKECRKVGAHTLVKVYSPSEIDCAGLDKNASGEYGADKIQQRATKIIGDTYASWKRLNPDAYPTILFAPSIEGSIWFAEQWCDMGVRVAHLDGASCYLPEADATGSLQLVRYDSTPALREEVLQMSKRGDIKVLMNRFVLREAIDMPWMRHGIEATVFGGLSTYLQSIGRIQRNFEGVEFKIWQSHGGSYWRHGSPNMERKWSLGDTNVSLARQRLEAISRSSSPEEAEGICCPKCSGWRSSGGVCPHCNHSHKRSARLVVQLDGKLELMRGIVNKPKKKAKPTTQDSLWVKTLFRSGAIGQPVSSAVQQWAAQCRQAGIIPNASALQYRPPASDTIDWHKEVGSVFPWVKKRKAKK